jgi:hypothetical protein
MNTYLNPYFFDTLALKLVAFAALLLLLSWALKRIRWSGQIAHLASVQPIISRVSDSRLVFAKLPYITAAPEGSCPLLRTILVDDLACREITEITGGGDAWWDFTYKGVRFTCKLLPKTEHGSELYRTAGTGSAMEEDPMLQLLAYKIAWQAAIKTGLTCHTQLCLKAGS